MNKKLEEAIKAVKNRNKKLKENIAKGYYYGEQYNIEQEIKEIETLLNYIDNSIPKEVIIDKIKKLDEKRENTDEFDSYTWNPLLDKIEVLQELLEGK